MAEATGLRERKKLRTRRAIAEAAIALFLERGFDNVSVAEVAAAAEVAKMTVFNYFPAKEDLVLARIEDHVDDAAGVVRGRRPGEPPVAALRRGFLAGLRDHSVHTGLNDTPHYLALQRMVMETPSLRCRLAEQVSGAEESLAAALAEAIGADPADLVPRLAAVQVLGAQRVLVVRNLKRVLAGAKATDVLPVAVAEAEAAYDLLAHGLGGSGLG